ncbi:hypothetical protein P879_04567 [Paragonimus westermani]|uniref:VWFA domain-containing protein n=1 Tax=Paragonimus westermani TaxID=34504 RepID=A0A8T0DQR6_9TREM|nr:hypothetical protein P879_04567 [Paragonimus westermani]
MNSHSFTCSRFHAYQNIVRLPEFSATHWDPEQSQAGITICELEYGGWPTSLTQREDCVLIFEELEEARTTLEQIQQILKDVERIPRQCTTVLVEQDTGGETVCQPAPVNNTCGKREERMSSKEWLERHSLKAQHLGLYETLASVAFKHCDGVVDLLKPPAKEVSLKGNELSSTDGLDSQYSNEDEKHCKRNDYSESSQPATIVHPKLINARYCDEFVHILWKDGSLAHVQVTPQFYRLYSRRVKATLTAIQRRIDWLCEGSRELFGTITEDESAADWVKNLSCSGTTNTLAALQFALACKRTQGIYLLSDGRPDQDPKTVLLKMHLINRIPINTVSFNCADKEANQFLFDLAKESGGRFHYFSNTSRHPASADQWESEDLRLLRQEYRHGLDCLEKMAQLRDECQRLAWKSTKAPTMERNNKIVKRKTRRPARSRSMYTIGRRGSSDTILDSDQTLTDNNQTAPLQRGGHTLKQRSDTAAFVRYPEIIESKSKKLTGSKSPVGCRSRRDDDYDPYYAFVKSLHEDHAQNEDFILFETKEVLDRQAKRYQKQVKAQLTTKLTTRGSKLKAEQNNTEP